MKWHKLIPMKPIRIATRGSRLALAQTELVKTALLNLNPRVEISIEIISTKGDHDPTDFLYKSSSVGFFTSEIENALLDGRADLAVHSFKDLPTEARGGLVLAAIVERDSPADVLVASGPLRSIDELPTGAVVGTSSLRRIAQLLTLRNDLECVPLRGNVETRLSRVESGQIDAAVVACAGLNRLGLSHRISLRLSPVKFIPAPAQGALALQIRSDDRELAELVKPLDHRDSRIAVEAERCVLARMQGGCSIPLGVYAFIEGDEIHIYANLTDPKGKISLSRDIHMPVDQAQDAARQVAAYLINEGGRELLQRIRSKEYGTGC